LKCEKSNVSQQTNDLFILRTGNFKIMGYQVCHMDHGKFESLAKETIIWQISSLIRTYVIVVIVSIMVIIDFVANLGIVTCTINEGKYRLNDFNYMINT
jgi:hypothetical protein